MRLLPAVLFVLAALCIALGVFYFSVDTNFLADDFGRHPTHGIAATGLGIVLAIAGIVARRRQAK